MSALWPNQPESAMNSSNRLLKKTQTLRCRSIASLRCTTYERLEQRAGGREACPSEAEGSIFRAPRLWIFLSSLQEAFSAPC